ncbi:MAG TPA: hypothetical protein PLX71_00560 [Phycicoccus sp.]|nr:hypothetical protein [Phycicoccus sp.]
MSAEHDHHGNSVAAWVCNLLLVAAFGVGSLAVVFLSVPMAVAAGIIGVVGLIAGKVLAARGYGVAGRSTAAGH